MEMQARLDDPADELGIDLAGKTGGLILILTILRMWHRHIPCPLFLRRPLRTFSAFALGLITQRVS
jgi:hypothetical protein